MIGDYHFLSEFGCLPRAGGVLDQEPRFVDAARVIANEIARLKAAIE